MKGTVPGRGWCTVAGFDIVVASNFGILGPFSEGDFLRRVVMTVTADAATMGRFGASVGGSNEASAEAYMAGTPVIQRSMVAAGGVPEIDWYAIAGVPLALVFPVGVVVSAGARYVVFHWNSSNVINRSIMVCAEVVELRKYD